MGRDACTIYGSLTLPRPHVPPPGYPLHPRELGEHLRKRRLDLTLYQKQVAKRLGVDEMTIVNWEKGRTQPSLTHLPSLITFLGYVPFDCEPDPLGRMRYHKKVSGLSMDTLARELGVHASTVSGWLAGTHQPTAQSMERIEAFVRTKALGDAT